MATTVSYWCEILANQNGFAALLVGMSLIPNMRLTAHAAVKH